MSYLAWLNSNAATLKFILYMVPVSFSLIINYQSINNYYSYLIYLSIVVHPYVPDLYLYNIYEYNVIRGLVHPYYTQSSG